MGLRAPGENGWLVKLASLVLAVVSRVSTVDSNTLLANRLRVRCYPRGSRGWSDKLCRSARSVTAPPSVPEHKHVVLRALLAAMACWWCLYPLVLC